MLIVFFKVSELTLTNVSILTYLSIDTFLIFCFELKWGRVKCFKNIFKFF